MVILDNSRTLGAFERQSDTWTLREQEEINKLDLTQGLHIFLYDIYTGIISHCQTNKPTNQEPLYESEHIIILDSDSTIGCQE